MFCFGVVKVEGLLFGFWSNIGPVNATGDWRTFVRICLDVFASWRWDIEMQSEVFQSCAIYEMSLIMKEKWKFIPENTDNSERR